MWRNLLTLNIKFYIITLINYILNWTKEIHNYQNVILRN